MDLLLYNKSEEVQSQTWRGKIMDNMRINTGQYIGSITPKQTDAIKQPKQDFVTEWQQPVGDTVNIDIPVEMPALKQKKELPPPPVVKEIVHKDKPAVPSVPLNLFMEDPMQLISDGLTHGAVSGLKGGYQQLSGTSMAGGYDTKQASDLEFAKLLGPFGVGEIINRETAPPGTEFFATGLNSIGSLKDGLFNVDGEKLA
jgi:hypothetical protein